MNERFRQYLLIDHRARVRNDLASLAISIGWYALSIYTGVPEADSLRVSLYFLAAGMILSTGFYVLVPRRLETSVSLNISKRTFAVYVAGAVVSVIAFGFGPPVLEAAITDHRLRKALAGEPTEEKFIKATEIIMEAKEKGWRASPEVVSKLGARVIESANIPSVREAALSCALAFANYRSTLTLAPQITSSVPIQGNIQVGCIGGPVGNDVPLLEGVPWFKQLDFRNCSRVSIRPLPPMNLLGELPIDGLDARNIVFVDATMKYGAGALDITDVQFVNCRIRVDKARIADQNVQLFLAAVVGGRPVSLHLR